MADSQRTLTDLLTNLFQDGQADGAISEQDMRDLIVSIGQPPRGGMFISSAIETDLNGAGGG